MNRSYFVRQAANLAAKEIVRGIVDTLPPATTQHVEQNMQEAFHLRAEANSKVSEAVHAILRLAPPVKK